MKADRGMAIQGGGREIRNGCGDGCRLYIASGLGGLNLINASDESLYSEIIKELPVRQILTHPQPQPLFNAQPHPRPNYRLERSWTRIECNRFRMGQGNAIEVCENASPYNGYWVTRVPAAKTRMREAEGD